MIGKIIASFLLIVAIAAVFLIIPVSPSRWTSIGRREIYYVELPIGKFWVDTEGSFVFGCGKIDSTLEESYNIKYFKDGELRSITVMASDTPIIPDGTFYLELRRQTFRNIYGHGISFDVTHLAIHVPALPNINETLRWNLP